jgi:hypothetical protein
MAALTWPEILQGDNGKEWFIEHGISLQPWWLDWILRYCAIMGVWWVDRFCFAWLGVDSFVPYFSFRNVAFSQGPNGDVVFSAFFLALWSFWIIIFVNRLWGTTTPFSGTLLSIWLSISKRSLNHFLILDL